MKKRGFTLIELLVVIAIIAILAAILFPVFLSAKERGRQAKCCSNLKQLTMAFLGYVDDNNGYLPISQRRQMMRSGNPATSADPIEWTGSQWSAYGASPLAVDVRMGSIYKGGYARNVGVFNCPSDMDIPCYSSYGRIGWSVKTLPPRPPGATDATAAGLPAGFGTTYSVNEDLSSKQPLRADGSPGYLTTIKLTSAVAGRTGKVLFLIHESRGSATSNGQNDGYFQWTAGDPQGEIHWKGTTCSYADSHVKWISNAEIQRTEFPATGVSQWHRNSYYYKYPNPGSTE